MRFELQRFPKSPVWAKHVAIIATGGIEQMNQYKKYLDQVVKKLLIIRSDMKINVSIRPIFMYQSDKLKPEINSRFFRNHGLLRNLATTWLHSNIETLIFLPTRMDVEPKVSKYWLCKPPKTSVCLLGKSIFRKNELTTFDFCLKTMQMSRSVFKTLGGFSHEFIGLGLYNEDHDFLVRLNHHGYHIMSYITHDIKPKRSRLNIASMDLRMFLPHDNQLTNASWPDVDKNIQRLPSAQINVLVLSTELNCLKKWFNMDIIQSQSIHVPENLDRIVTFGPNFKTCDEPNVSEEYLKQLNSDYDYWDSLAEAENAGMLLYPYIFLRLKGVDYYQTKMIPMISGKIIALLSNYEILPERTYILNCLSFSEKVKTTIFVPIQYLDYWKLIKYNKEKNMYIILKHKTQFSFYDNYFSTKKIKNNTIVIIDPTKDTKNIYKRIQRIPDNFHMRAYKSPVLLKQMIRNLPQRSDFMSMYMNTKKDYESPIRFSMNSFFYFEQIIISLYVLNIGGSMLVPIPIMKVDDCNFIKFFALISCFFENVIFTYQTTFIHIFAPQDTYVILQGFKGMSEQKLRVLDQLYILWFDHNSKKKCVNTNPLYRTKLRPVNFVHNIVNVSPNIEQWITHIKQQLSIFEKQTKENYARRRRNMINLQYIITNHLTNELQYVFRAIVDQQVDFCLKFCHENNFALSAIGKIYDANLVI